MQEANGLKLEQDLPLLLACESKQRQDDHYVTYDKTWEDSLLDVLTYSRGTIECYGETLMFGKDELKTITQVTSTKTTKSVHMCGWFD